MSYAKKRAEGVPKKDIYEAIRKKTTEEALTTGKCWIATTDGVPMVKLTMDESKELAQWLYDNATKEERARIRFRNILTGSDLSVEKVHGR